MSEEIESLLFEIAAFLKMVETGMIPIEQQKKEASELSEKIGKTLA